MCWCDKVFNTRMEEAGIAVLVLMYNRLVDGINMVLKDMNIAATHAGQHPYR